MCNYSEQVSRLSQEDLLGQSKRGRASLDAYVHYFSGGLARRRIMERMASSIKDLASSLSCSVICSSSNVAKSSVLSIGP